MFNLEARVDTLGGIEPSLHQTQRVQEYIGCRAPTHRVGRWSCLPHRLRSRSLSCTLPASNFGEGRASFPRSRPPFHLGDQRQHAHRGEVRSSHSAWRGTSLVCQPLIPLQQFADRGGQRCRSIHLGRSAEVSKAGVGGRSFVVTDGIRSSQWTRLPDPNLTGSHIPGMSLRNAGQALHTSCRNMSDAELPWSASSHSWRSSCPTVQRPTWAPRRGTIRPHEGQLLSYFLPSTQFKPLPAMRYIQGMSAKQHRKRHH